MRPKIHCAACGADLAWGTLKCPSCGTAIEWPAQTATKPESTASKTTRGGLPTRNIIIVVALIGVGVIALEYLSGGRSVPTTVSQAPSATGTETGANMAALPHIQELEQRANAEPDNLELRRELANHLMDNRFYDKAIAVYRQVLDKVPNDANVRVDMGICYKETGDLVSAEREMLEALKLQPRHLHGHFNLGIVRLVQGDVTGAAEWFRKTHDLEPNSELGKRAKQLLDQHMAVSSP